MTDSDWRELAMAALQALNFPIARKAFIRIRDVRYIELLNRIEIARRNPAHDDGVFLGDILAFQGQYAEAARLYCKANQRKKAIEMYLDLRDWEHAKQIVEEMGADASAGAGEDADGVSMGELLKRQAGWLMEVNDMKGAAEMYWAAKEHGTAISLLGDHGWLQELMDKVRQLNKSQRKHLAAAAAYFRKAGHHAFAKETYLKMDDIQALMELHVETHHWEEAFALAKQKPEFARDIYEPYAEWLALHDRFDEAQDAFKLAGKPQESLRMLTQLTHNAVTENRYNDAGYYYWLLATEVLKNLTSPSAAKLTPADAQALERFAQYQSLSEVYYAYHSIYRYTDEPFTSLLPDALFQTAQYILNHVRDPVPHGISKVYTLFALAKQGKVLGAFKLARQAYTKLLGLKMPASWKDQIDLACLTVRTKPYSDEESLLPVCYRCSTSNPLLNLAGDVCINCRHQFIRSFCSFETLPLVAFEVEQGISDEDALKYLEMDPADTVKYGGVGLGGAGRDAEVQTNINVMSLDASGGGEDGAEEGVHPDDEFHAQLHHFEADNDGQFPAIRVGIKGLVAMKREEVFVRRWKQTSVVRAQYYRSVIPDLPITLCPHCNHFFHEEDFEHAAMVGGNKCPFCRGQASLEEAAPHSELVE